MSQPMGARPPGGGPRSLMGPDTLPENATLPPGTIPRVVALFRPHKVGLSIVSAIVIISG
ncbi:MAG: hypothetical protein F2740_03910, partial [Actinobacteria bacterium]|nr:hypothetical protein [Actinomycetota bacterium]